jgi:chemotaxis protein MotB
MAAGAFAFTLMSCAPMHRKDLANDLRNALAGSPVTVSQQGDKIVLTSSADYMFPSGGWQIPSDAPVLNRIAPILAKLQNTQIAVRGYTDNTPVGPQLQSMGIANNNELSTRRAQSVVDYLASHGVNRSLMSAQGFGESNPVVSNDTPQGRSRNRRVDIVLTGDGT